jgi:hypothetical protein
MEDAMTGDDDAKKLAEISRELPPIDLDDVSAQRIALRARQQVGKGPPLTRFIEPAVIVLFTTSMVAWIVYKLVEILG